jgi:hypothetical protein
MQQHARAQCIYLHRHVRNTMSDAGMHHTQTLDISDQELTPRPSTSSASQRRVTFGLNLDRTRPKPGSVSRLVPVPLEPGVLLNFSFADERHSSGY